MAVDALQALQQQRGNEKARTSSDVASPKRNDGSQQSTHSVVSNNSAEFEAKNKATIPTYVSAPSAGTTSAQNNNNSSSSNYYAYTESQVQRQDASEALAALAGLG
jgi:hypothetical protein